MQKEKKQKDRERREMENANRRHLANMRVMQKNLVYVVGLPPKLAHEEVKISHVNPLSNLLMGTYYRIDIKATRIFRPIRKDSESGNLEESRWRRTGARSLYNICKEGGCI
jgi:hypothetical protein